MNAAERREAREQRDRSYDGRFFFAVVTTGVYCRPSCASRLALERNVRYFADAAQAQRAGFRPCKRCRPDEGTGVDERIGRACAILDTADEPVSLTRLGELVGYSPAHLQRRFSAVVGVSPRRYGQLARERRLREGLGTAPTITAAIQAAGFGSAASAYASAREHLGMTPSTVRAGAPAESIYFALSPSPLGSVLVAATQRGICRVDLDDEADALVARLRAAFPKAHLTRADDRVETATSRIVAYLSKQGPWPQLPLDVRASAFTMRVWDALRAITPGTTMHYGELARALGSPSAARAVARACASNPVALLIPCHRIVPAGGGVGGYRWGAQRKRALLDLENAG